MANYTIILGENGQGKTRYLLRTLKQRIGPASIAVISNAAMTSFPIQKQIKSIRYALFNVKAQGLLGEQGYRI